MKRINTVIEASKIVESRDFSVVRDFMVSRQDYGPEQVEEMEKEYKRYIAICAVNATKKEPLPISASVDPFWHAHILHTEDYIDMSNQLGSVYFHHTPAAGDELVELEPAYNKMLNIYEKNFGKPSEKFWPQFDQICGLSGCSCSGTGN